MERLLLETLEYEVRYSLFCKVVIPFREKAYMAVAARG